MLKVMGNEVHVKPVLSGHSKKTKTWFSRPIIVKCRSKVLQNASSHSQKDQNLVFKTDYRLVQVKSIAECCNTFDLH